MNRIAVRLPNWVGDCVMATPVLGHLRACHPGAEIVAIGRGNSRGVLENNPHIDRLWIAEDRGIGNIRELAGRLRREKVDLGVLLPNSVRSAIPFALGGVKRRVGYALDGRGLLLTDRVKTNEFHYRCHQVDYYLNVLADLETCNVEEADRSLVLRPTGESREAVRDLLEKRGLASNRLLAAISPGAAYGSSKCWPPDRFARVADILGEKFGATVLLLGAPNEEPLCREIAGMSGKHVHNLGADVSLAMLIALCERLSLFVTNDCGAMHIAAAMRTPLIAIFGPTDPRRTRPYDPDAVVLEEIDTCGCDIAPCYKKKCPIDHRCMTAVTPADVEIAIQKQFDRLKART